MIYTSYFGNRRIPSDAVQIAIARYTPKWWRGIQYSPLAPTGKMLRNLGEYYDRKFKEMLENLDQDQVVEELKNLANGKDIVLLCYEKPPKRCHRYKVMLWLKEAGYEVEECPFKGSEKLKNVLPNGEEEPKPEDNQSSMF